MPVYQLSEELIFPNPQLADPDGVLAVGGDLEPERLLLAYVNGIFPWYGEGDPIIWHSPDPRFILYPKDIKVSDSMKQIFRSGKFQLSADTAFQQVIRACKTVPRPGQNDTWITDDMLEAYIHLHHLGYAHSIEIWEKQELVGGLYGVSMGGCFFGESMFSLASNSSKTALIALSTFMDFDLIDCQVYTPHLETMGATEVNRGTFLSQLKEFILKPTKKGKWTSYWQALKTTDLVS